MIKYERFGHNTGGIISPPPFERFICPSQCVDQNSVHEIEDVVHHVRLLLRPLILPIAEP